MLQATLTHPDDSPADNTDSTTTIVAATCDSAYNAGRRCPQNYVFANGNQTLPDNSLGTFEDECCVSNKGRQPGTLRQGLCFGTHSLLNPLGAEAWQAQPLSNIWREATSLFPEFPTLKALSLRVSRITPTLLYCAGSQVQAADVGITVSGPTSAGVGEPWSYKVEV